MKVSPISAIIGMQLIEPNVHSDHRGYFVETYRKDLLAMGGIADDFPQHNQTLSLKGGTVRGFHFQVPGYNRIARVVWGRVFFAAVDLRVGSPTFKQVFTCELDDEKMQEVYIPSGVAWAFMAMEDNCIMQYVSSRPYDGKSDRTLYYADVPGIEWPKIPVILSDRDRAGLTLEKWLNSKEGQELRYE